MLAATRLVKPFSGLLILFVIVIPASAQKNLLKGVVVDTAEKKKLHYAIIALINRADSSLYRSFRSTSDGAFEVAQLPAGRYTLMVAYPKMADFLQDLSITDTSRIDLGTVPMVTEAKLLEEVVVRAGVPIRMRGDTLEYTADSFAVKPGSNVEELLKRLPGIQVERNGKIYAQGQEVKKVLVDGDEFFSDDPGLATKYLQAGAVDKVQVFDQKTEQAEFTGIDDGTRNKTINLKLKKDKKNGYFGKLSAGADGREYYQHEAMGALFNGTQKISVFGMAAKTGKAGLNYQDMSKYVTRDYELISDGAGGTIYSSSSNDYESDSYYGNGIPSVLYGGAHFSDKWNRQRSKVFGNYRIKNIRADGWNRSWGSNILPDGSGFYATSDGRDESSSLTQQASGSTAISLDSFAVLKIAANGSLGKTEHLHSSTAASRNEKGFPVNSNNQTSRRLSDSKRFGSNIAYERKFRKEGRTLSLAFQQEYSNNLTDVYAFSAINKNDPASGRVMDTDTLDQLQQTRNPFQSYAVRGAYTDKLSKDLGVSLEYAYKTAQAANVFNTFDAVNEKYTARIDSLSNDYDFTVNTHITGATLTYSKKKMNISAGGRIFHTGMEQVNNDRKLASSRRFINLAPQLNMVLRVLKNTSINFRYTGQTEQPSIEQLQPLRRTSNQLYIQEGNPELKPTFRHNGHVYFNQFNALKGSYMFGSVSLSYLDNAITMQRTTDAQNKTTARYINLDGVVGLNAMLNYSWNIKKWHLRTEVRGSVGKGGNNSITNGVKFKNEHIYTNGEVILTHTWKEYMTTAYEGGVNYNVGWSDAPNNKTSRNLRHNHVIRNDFFLPWKLQLQSECDFQFQPRNKAFNNSLNIMLWNVFLEKKFGKDNEVQARFSVNDLLNKNTGYSRYVSGTSINESDKLVLKRYWLLTLTWNFNKKI